jgi:hypothetical protein
MASKVEQAKAYLDELHKKIVDLNLEIVAWKFDSQGTEAGTTLEVSVKLLIPKQNK